MTKPIRLSDAQLVCLNAACQRADRKLLPLPASMKNPMINSRIEAGLRSRGLVEGEGKNATVTDAAFAALGIPLEDEGQQATSPSEQPRSDSAEAAPAQPQEEPEMAKTKSKSARGRRAQNGSRPQAESRPNSKQARMIELMRRPEGASLDELVRKFEWEKHTVRGAVAGALKKKLKLKVTSEKDEKRGLVYRIAA